MHLFMVIVYLESFSSCGMIAQEKALSRRAQKPIDIRGGARF